MVVNDDDGLCSTCFIRDLGSEVFVFLCLFVFFLNKKQSKDNYLPAADYLPATHCIHHQTFREHQTLASNSDLHKYIKNIQLTKNQIDFYHQNGYLVIEDALNNIPEWLTNFDDAVNERSSSQIFPDNDTPWAQASLKANKKSNNSNNYRQQVFTQRIYLSKTNEQIRPLVFSAGRQLARLASELADIDTVRLWHEEALIKPPFSNQLKFHWDAPSWSFNYDQTLTAWIALDDISYDNGCMWVLPTSHRLLMDPSEEVKYSAPDVSKLNMNTVMKLVPGLSDIQPIPVPVKRGSIEFHSALLVHASGPNLRCSPMGACLMESLTF
jgi:ectoine hydroxylase-related dioxygenase (phytanoyl-CoA dioxygenase family)